MTIRKPKVLLVREKPNQPSLLAEHLQAKGCDCAFATSYDEIRSCLMKESFDLVCSPTRLRGVSLFSLMDLLEGSEATLFYFHAVEEGFWCLPALRQGQRCFGSSGLRPSEFLSHLDELIAEIEANRSRTFRPGPKRAPFEVPRPSPFPSELIPPGTVRAPAVRAKRKAGA